jgi:hypothetical protein
MPYKEIYPTMNGIAVGKVFDLFGSALPDSPEIIRGVVESILEEAYAQGHDDGVELMRDPAYSQEHV